MNQNKRTSLAVVAIVATMTLTAATFTIPQQVFAWGHHYHHHHNNNGIKVDQQISQLNVCSGQAQAPDHAELRVAPGVTVCLNNGNNNANIDK